MNLKKGDVFQVKIEEVRFPNRGIGFLDEVTVIVKNTIPGQTVRCMVQKKRNGTIIGRLLEVLERSKLETREPFCSLFPQCGGCTYQTMGYEHQLTLKEKQIRQLLLPVLTNAGMSEEEYPGVFEGIAHTDKEVPFRNKMEYTFGDLVKDGELTLGLHRKGSNFDILPCTDCAITHEDYNRIVECVMTFGRRAGLKKYNKLTHEGYLRNLLVRRAEYTKEILIALVTTTQEHYDFTALKEELLGLPLEGGIAGILHMHYDGVADIVRSEKTDVLFGREYIYDRIFGLTFKISPFSFFQTNTKGAEVLYGIVRDYIGDISDAQVFDLYSGTGTIAQILSAAAKKVTAVEIVEEAVLAARENALANGIENCEFICGDVLKALDEIPEKPDYIVLDPPRDGINAKALQKIIDYGAERIVYVSCKPTSLARDLELLLAGGYEVQKIRLADMFPESVHCESVVKLTKTGTYDAEKM